MRLTKLTRRRLLRWCGLAGIAAFAAGCTEASTTPSHTPTAAPKAPEAPKPAPTSNRIALRWVGWEKPERFGFADIAAQFGREFPQLAVTYEWLPDRYNEKLAAMYSAGNPPDIVETTGDAMPASACRGLLAPLDDYVNKTDWSRNRAKYYDYFWTGSDMSRWGQGRFMAAIACFVPTAYAVNLDLFQAAGVKAPPMEWEDAGYWNTKGLLAAAQALTKRDGVGRPTQYGICIRHRSGFETTWAPNNGGGVFDSDVRRFALAEQRGADLVQWVADLTNTHQVQPTRATLTRTSATDLFAAGKLAVLHLASSELPDLAPRVGGSFKWALAPVERGAADQRQYAETVMFSLTKASKHPQEAWSLLRYLLEEAAQKVIGTTGTGVPVRLDWARTYQPSIKDAPSSLTLWAEAMEHQAELPRSLGTARACGIYRPEIEQVLDGEKKASVALEAVREAVEAALAERCAPQ